MGFSGRVQTMEKTYKIHFTSDVYETVEVEAGSSKQAEEKLHKGEIDLSEAEEQGKENLKVDTVEEIDPTTDRPIKKDK